MSRRKAISHVAVRLPKRREPSKPNGARLRPASHYGKAHSAFDRTLIPPWSAFGTEIATSAASETKGPHMTERKTNRPTHRVYAVRKTGPETSYWAEIGAAWTNRDGQGFNMKLTLLPVGEADIVVREIRDEERGAR
jgi:hypothetical protein